MDAFMSNLGLLINATLVATPPLLLAALGSCFSERSGVINLGIEGMMTIGAFVGAAVGLVAHNGWIAFLAGGLAGALYGLNAIPEKWLNILKKRDYIEEMCETAGKNWIK